MGSLGQPQRSRGPASSLRPGREFLRAAEYPYAGQALGGAPAPKRPRVCPSPLCRSRRGRPWRLVRASSSLKQQLGLVAKESGVRQGLGQFSSRTGAQKDAQDTVPAFEDLPFWQGTSEHCQSESNHMLRRMWGAPAEGFLGGGEECTRWSRGQE